MKTIKTVKLPIYYVGDKFRIIKDATSKGHIVGVRFVKKNGKLRTMAFRKGVVRVNGNRPEVTAQTKITLKRNGMMCVFDMGKAGYRTVNLNTVDVIRAEGIRYEFTA